MKYFGRISTFLAIVLLITCAFSLSVFAVDETTSDDESGYVTITEKDYVWNIKCPSCGENQGLKYGTSSFVCENTKCGAEFEFTKGCSVCGKFNFAETEDGLYICVNEKCTGATVTVEDLLRKLVLVEKVEVDTSKLDMNEKPESFAERAEIALQGTATGMVMIFAVLGLLAVIVTLSKVICYDIPNKKKEKAKAAHAPAAVPAAPAETVQEAPAAVQPATDDGELIAVITAAVAAVIESSEYKNEFVGGFRVVSFKKSTNSAWNRK